MKLRRIDVVFIVAIAFLTVAVVVTWLGANELWNYVDYVTMFQVGMTVSDVQASWGPPDYVLEPGQENSIPRYKERGLAVPIRKEVRAYSPIPSSPDTVYLFIDDEDKVYYLYWCGS